MPHPHSTANLLPLCQAIQLVAFDVDGVLTDGRITYTSSGEELKSFCVKDGQGIALLNKAGLHTALITARSSPINQRRGEELGIAHIHQNAKPKLPVLLALCQQLGIELQNVAYMGDDLPDLEILKLVGLACCPANAVAEVRQVCAFVSQHTGGNGAARELCELILKAQGKFPGQQAVRQHCVSGV